MGRPLHEHEEASGVIDADDDAWLPNITPGEALKRAYEADARVTAANAAAKKAREEKVTWRLIAEAKLEEAGLTEGVADAGDGRRAKYYQVQKPHFDIMEPEKVMEWATRQDETYIDPEPRLREQLIFEECRRLREAGQPLPPGVVLRTETEFHKQTLT